MCHVLGGPQPAVISSLAKANGRTAFVIGRHDFFMIDFYWNRELHTHVESCPVPAEITVFRRFFGLCVPGISWAMLHHDVQVVKGSPLFYGRRATSFQL